MCCAKQEPAVAIFRAGVSLNLVLGLKSTCPQAWALTLLRQKAWGAICS
jgi:hypothetical protein